jgi:hypothetical protein
MLKRKKKRKVYHLRRPGRVPVVREFRKSSPIKSYFLIALLPPSPPPELLASKLF